MCPLVTVLSIESHKNTDKSVDKLMICGILTSALASSGDDATSGHHYTRKAHFYQLLNARQESENRHENISNFRSGRCFLPSLHLEKVFAHCSARAI